MVRQWAADPLKQVQFLPLAPLRVIKMDENVELAMGGASAVRMLILHGADIGFER